MKKIRLLLTAALVGLITLLPTSAFADIVDDISQEFGYAYRWTVEAELDETYDGTWLGDMADDGKIRVSFIATEEPLVDGFDADRGVIVIEGNDEIVLGVRAYGVGNNASYSTYSTPKQLVKEDGEWAVKDITLGEGSTEDLSVGVYATGDERIEKRFLAIHPGRRTEARNGNKKSVVTIIGLDADGLDKAEDTELSLMERKKYYIKYMGNRTPASYSESGEVIWAKPIIRNDKKSPAVDSDYFFDDEPEKPEVSEDVDKPEENKVVYAPEKKVPEFDVTLKEAETAEISKVDDEGIDYDIGYGSVILNGKISGSIYRRSIQNGKAKFDITLPKEKVADVSSDGKITVSMQRYEVYKTYLPNKDMVFEYDDEENSDEIVLCLKGDLGEKAFYLDGFSEKYAENGVYSVHYRLYEIFQMDGNIVAFISHKRVPKSEAIGGLVDKNDENYVFTPIRDTILYCQFADRAYCGIEKIGFKFGDDIYTVDIDDTKMDFDVEVDLSDRIIGTKAARKLLAEIRAERSKNSEVVNILENGKPDFNINIEPEIPEEPEEIPEEPEEIPKEQIVSTDEIRVDLRGKFLEFADQKPIIENDRVLVPFRVIFEALEAEVFWDSDTRTVTATKGGITITLTIGKNEIVKNGEAVEIDVPAQIINSRTLVPVRVISESFENTVSWDGENKVVEIK